MSSIMLGDTTARVGVFYAANATDVPFHIADAAIALLRGEPYPVPERRAIEIDPNILDRYVGVYETGKDVFTITREGPALFIQKNKNAKKGQILAETPTHFFLKDDPATITFPTNSAGAIERMVIDPADWLIIAATKRP